MMAVIYFLPNVIFLIGAYYLVNTILNIFFLFKTNRKYKPLEIKEYRGEDISYGKHLSLMNIINTLATQIDNMKKRYWLPYDDPNAVNVLIINGLQYAQGMNLQITTDLIFYHKVVDKRIERQMAGRAMRYGRTNNLRIHYVLNANEFKLL